MCVKMNSNVENTIENLRHYTKSYTDELDKCFVPIKYDLVTEQQYTYILHGIEYHNFDRHSTLILAKKIPFTYGYIDHNYEKPLVDLINEDLVQPFLLFLNGKFVKWSDMTLIRDCNFDYIKIEGIYTPEAHESQDTQHSYNVFWQIPIQDLSCRTDGTP